jgi:hypothetical protein
MASKGVPDSLFSQLRTQDSELNTQSLEAITFWLLSGRQEQFELKGSRSGQAPRACASLRSSHERKPPPSEPPFESHPCELFGHAHSPQSSALIAQHCHLGGEGGIRTHGTVASSRALQARRFVHSRTSPTALEFVKGSILSRDPVSGKASIRTGHAAKRRPAHLAGIDRLGSSTYTATAPAQS